MRNSILNGWPYYLYGDIEEFGRRRRKEADVMPGIYMIST